MRVVAVGEPFLGATSLQERVEYNFHSGQHELLIALPSLSTREIENIRKNGINLALFVEQDILILLFEFVGAIPWSDAPYSWHLVKGEFRSVPKEIQLGQRIGLNIILVESTTAIVKGIRLIDLPTDFSLALNRSILDQVQRPFPDDYDHQLQAVYSRYPTPEVLSAHAQARAVIPAVGKSKGFGR